MWSKPRGAREATTGSDVLARLRTRLPGPLRTARAETPLAELPIDSLDLVELLCLIEDEFGVRLDEETFARLRTVDDLAAAVARHGSAVREHTLGARS